MITLLRLCWSAVLVVVTLPAQATVVDLVANGQWNSFTVDELVSEPGSLSWIDAETLSPGYGTSLSFSFTVNAGSVATLTVLDAGFAGDQFSVFSSGSLLGNTSTVPTSTFDPDAQSADFDTAFSDPTFSRGVFTFQAGSYSITGALIQSVMLDASTPLNSTIGAVKLSVAPVPIPAAVLLMPAALGALGFATRRRNV